MHIVADENIPYVREAFSALGEVHTVAGRQLQPTHLKNADILLVRSVTRVNEPLLANSPVCFVGTATIGCDHVDLAYLKRCSIAFASAPGSNATSTAEYVISSLLIVAERLGFKVADKKIGIIGCGNVGRRVLDKLQALNVTCRVYDPPLQETAPNAVPFSPLPEIFDSDVITLHVPLTRGGNYPTERMVNTAFLAQLKPEVILINTSRGNVVDDSALHAKLASCPKMTLVLDVWNDEPAIDLTLLSQVALGTPHIAGYSLDGKVRGTQMLYTAVCTHFGHTPTWVAHHCLPPPPLSRLAFTSTVEDEMAVKTAVLACYDVRSDDARLRLVTSAEHSNAYFDQLRKQYPLRREFSSVTIEVPRAKVNLNQQLRGLGFQIIEI